MLWVAYDVLRMFADCANQLASVAIGWHVVIALLLVVLRETQRRAANLEPLLLVDSKP